MVHASRPTSRISRSRRDVDDTCSKIITPACLQEIYGIPASSPNSTGNAITVTGYIGEFVQEADLQVCPDTEYWDCY
jgi:tripeptidyl-peptidase-1